MPKLCKLIFGIWIRRPRSVWPVNGFVVSSTTVTRKPFSAKCPGANGLTRIFYEKAAWWLWNTKFVIKGLDNFINFFSSHPVQCLLTSLNEPFFHSFHYDSSGSHEYYKYLDTIAFHQKAWNHKNWVYHTCFKLNNQDNCWWPSFSH